MRTAIWLALIPWAAWAQEDRISEDDLNFVRKVRALALESQPAGGMQDYRGTIRKAEQDYEMVAIPGGKFVMGSPDSEDHREEDEGPQRTVEVEPFWMGKYEITWDQYKPFMITNAARRKDGSRLKEIYWPESDLEDIVSSPTTPYTEMSFGMGEGRHPAVSMTQHAASKFCQWVSAQTGHYYRLPTEAEWEYACRAGTSTAYFFGDDPKEMDAYGWHWENSEDSYHEVGLKKPNPWGLYDMHGNVLEWCLDQYFKDSYRTGVVTIPATKLYQRVSRGGSWYDDPEDCRSARRFQSEISWKQQDPQLPRSMWYLTDGYWIGFRMVRPRKIPSAEEMYRLWNSAKIVDR